MIKVQQIHVTKSHSHIELELDKIERNLAVPFDIFIKKKDDFFIIVKAGTVISEKIYHLLQQQKALYISSDDKANVDVSKETLGRYIYANKENLSEGLKLLYKFNNKLFEDFEKSEDNKIHKESIESLVDAIILLMLHHEHYLKDIIEKLSNEYTLANHSLHVAIYSIHLAHFIKMKESDLKKIGIAGIIFDIGLKKVNLSSAHKDTKLSEKELAVIDKHSTYSAELALHNRISDPYIIEAIRHHHENQDGTGHPDHLEGDAITPFASILSICDVFDALTNDRPYRKRMSTFNALTVMLKDPEMINKFNTKYLKIFLQSLV